MAAKKTSIDLISNLPDEIRHHILSFMRTELAATTSILSKQWRDVFVFSSTLTVDFPEDANEIAFMAFVDRVVAMRGNTPLKKLCLTIGPGGVDEARIQTWIVYALERGVSDLDLSIFLWLQSFRLPLDLFVTESLVRLGVGGCLIAEECVVNLPKLKYLKLDDVQFEDEHIGFDKLLSGCPLLEDLVMEDMKWEEWDVCCLSHKNLQNLRINWVDTDEDDHTRPKKISLDLPCLIYLNYTDHIAEEYLVLNLPSLVEAEICLNRKRNSSDEDEDEAGLEDNDCADFLQGICNVQNLLFRANTLEALTFSCSKIPVFDSVRRLDIDTNPQVGWQWLPTMIGNCPNLETLIFDV